MPRPWNRQEALAQAQEMVAAARSMIVEKLPAPTKRGCEWHCNTCPYRTRYVTEAIDHVETAGPLTHMVYEVEPLGGEKVPRKVGRRVCRNPESGNVVVERKPDRAAAGARRG